MTDPLDSPQLKAMEPGRTAAAALPTDTAERPDFRAIFDLHFDYIWFTLRRFGVPERDLDDLAHDVFIQVYRHLDQYDATRPLRPWLFGFAYRIASDYRRLARHRRETLGEPCEGVDGAPSASDRVATRQKLDLVWTALEQLDLDRRAIFVLHDVEGHSIPEVASTLGIPLNTAYSRLRLAREQFAKSMQRLRSRQGER
ncbi:MAG TPA: sigma-70 family RNA polymerase sigma factor [Polyangiaceae bacterium]|nr:sigma-70 family RNA polymerase sigma factor [Polyangiaceae bacterium]